MQASNDFGISVEVKEQIYNKSVLLLANPLAPICNRCSYSKLKKSS